MREHPSLKPKLRISLAIPPFRIEYLEYFTFVIDSTP